jgi:cathepsin F
MKSVIILLLLASVFSSIQLDNTTFAKFMKFANEHNKVYSSMMELLQKYETFKVNMQKIQVLKDTNSVAGQQHTFEFGVTKFMDLTTEEFAQQYLNLNISHMSKLKSASNPIRVNDRFKDTPASYDWREHGAVSSVKDQGQCGSCWAFSAVGNLEGQHQIKAGGKIVDLSPQQLVDCDKVDLGCGGGLMADAFTYVKNAGGIEALADYKYTGRDNKCSFDVTKAVVKVTGFNMAQTEDEEVIKTMLFQNGPLAIAINANPLQFYFGGIFNPWFSWICDPASLDHGVLIVGYGVEGTTKYWIVKNSWGPSWGEKGYFRIIAGKGACGVNKYVVTANVQ